MLHAFLLVLVGLAGDPEHGELFHKWGGELAEAAGHLGVPAEHVVYLVDQPGEGEAHVSGKATVEEINKTFDRFAKEATPEDEVYVVLGGSGAFFNGGKIERFGPGDVIFVPAHVEHRFERFTDDLVVWVIFYGPEGGEAAQAEAP